MVSILWFRTKPSPFYKSLEHLSIKILKIPLISTTEHDSRFWKNDSKGRYTVRSGYHTACGTLSPPENQSSRSTEAWWKFIWNLNIPLKIRIFWWRLSNDIIPTSANLRMHHIHCLSSCSLCGYYRDSSIHALFLCPAVKHIWKETELWPIISGIRDLETLDCCLWLKMQMSITEFERLATVTWGLWKNRMAVIYGNESGALSQSLDWCDNFIREFKESNEKLHSIDNSLRSGGPPITNAVSSSGPPFTNVFPPGTMQMEVDACINESLQQY